VRLSVVVPVYNGAKYLEGCLGSVTTALEALPAADRASIEVVVCDNHSTDGSGGMAEAVAAGCSAYRVVRPPEHYENRTRNWNAAMAAARGEWVQMLHADDLMAPSGLVNALRAVRRAGPDVNLVWGRQRVFSDHAKPGRLRPVWPLPATLRGADLARGVLSVHCCLPPFTVVRREAYERIGGFDEQFQLVQDWDLWLRLLAPGGAVYYPATEFCWWRDHPVSGWYNGRMADEHRELARQLPRIAPGFSAGEYAAGARSLEARSTNWSAKNGPPAAPGEPATTPSAEDRESADQELRVVRRRVARRLSRLFAGGTLGMWVRGPGVGSRRGG
jgi:hypothetical protein